MNAFLSLKDIINQLGRTKELGFTVSIEETAVEGLEFVDSGEKEVVAVGADGEVFCALVLHHVGGAIILEKTKLPQFSAIFQEIGGTDISFLAMLVIQADLSCRL